MPPERPQACRPAGSPSTNPVNHHGKKGAVSAPFLYPIDRNAETSRSAHAAGSRFVRMQMLSRAVAACAHSRRFSTPEWKGRQSLPALHTALYRMLGMRRLPVLHAPLSVSLPEGKCSPIPCPPHKLSSCSIFLPHKGGMGALPPWLSIALDLSCLKGRSPLPP